MAEKRLPILESFYSLQGEGYNVGVAAYFIRLAGCNVRCPWCDTPNSWDIASGELRKIEDIVNEAVETGAKNVVITGGEPLIHNLDELTTLLKSCGLKVWLETSGSAPLSGVFDWICLSPKKWYLPENDEIFKRANELKVVVESEEDFIFAQECKGRAGGQTILSLQPQWSADELIASKIVDFIKQNPEWRLSLQTHKYLNIR